MLLIIRFCNASVVKTGHKSLKLWVILTNIKEKYANHVRFVKKLQ